jgi:hypothetical protein
MQGFKKQPGHSQELPDSRNCGSASGRRLHGQLKDQATRAVLGSKRAWRWCKVMLYKTPLLEYCILILISLDESVQGYVVTKAMVKHNLIQKIGI